MIRLCGGNRSKTTYLLTILLGRPECFKLALP